MTRLFRDKSKECLSRRVWEHGFQSAPNYCSCSLNANLVPRASLFLPRESTLAAAGHVSARFLQIPEN